MFGKKQVYRDVSLERLSSPEQLDQLMQITTPKGWLALAAVGLLLGVVLLWGVIGSIPTTIISQQCVLLKAGGVNTIVALDTGQIRRLYVSPGDQVLTGQILARITAIDQAGSSRITSPYDGVVLELSAAEGGLINAGEPLLTIDSSAQGAQKLEAVIYIPASDGKKVQNGMEAQISPSTVKREEYGFMKGEISQVGVFPATASGMLQVLGNPKLVEEFSQVASPIESRAILFTDSTSPSGFVWSSRGPEQNIENGTPCSAQIVVERKRPISMVIPLLRESVGL